MTCPNADGSGHSRGGTWLSLARTMNGYDAAIFLAGGKHMISDLATVMEVLMISGVFVGLIVVVLLFRVQSAVAGWFALAGLLLMLSAMAITL